MTGWSEEAEAGGVLRRGYLSPLGGIFGTVEAGRQEQEQADKKVVEGEDLRHHGPLPAKPRHGEQPSGQDCPRTRTCQPESGRRRKLGFFGNVSFFTEESLRSFGPKMNLWYVIIKEMSRFQDFRTFLRFI